MPTVPLGFVIYEGITRRNLSYNEAIRLINAAGVADGVKNAGYDRTALKGWLTGVIPPPRTQRWIASALGLSAEELAKAADKQRLEQARVSSTDEGRARSTSYVLAEDPFLVVRREFLERMLAAGTLLLGSPHMRIATPLAPSSRNPSIDADQLISDCQANLASCWRLINGNDINIVPSVLLSWLPVIDAMLREPSEFRDQLAALAAQGYILAGLVTVLQGRYDYAEWCCRQAVEYANIAGDPNLIVASIKHLAAKYHSAGYPLLTLHTYEEALPLLSQASPLLQGRTYLGIALAHAKCGNEYGSERYWDLAQETFPDHDRDDPAFSYADCRRSSLNHYGGLIHLAFGRPRDAWLTLASGVQVPPSADVPERTVVEIINCQAEAAIAQDDLELASNHIEAALAGAQRLKSQKRWRDTASIYQRLRDKWPNEPRVRDLRDLFYQTDDHHHFLSPE